MDGASIDPLEPKNTNAIRAKIPITMPRTIPIARSERLIPLPRLENRCAGHGSHFLRPRTTAPRPVQRPRRRIRPSEGRIRRLDAGVSRALGADAVEEPPVGGEGAIGGCDNRVLVLGAADQLLEQLAALGGVLDVAAAVDREVARAGRVGDPVVLGEPLELRLGDLGLAALDRIEAGERREGAVTLGPDLDAIGGLGVGPGAGVAADRGREPVPQVDVLALLGSVAVELGVVGQIGGDLLRQRRDRGNGVAVLPGVVGELLGGQLTR